MFDCCFILVALKKKKEEENFVSLPFFLFSLCRPVVRYSGGDAATPLASASAHAKGRLQSSSRRTRSASSLAHSIWASSRCANRRKRCRFPPSRRTRSASGLACYL